jgi:hypothetical protein
MRTRTRTGRASGPLNLTGSREKRWPAVYLRAGGGLEQPELLFSSRRRRRVCFLDSSLAFGPGRPILPPSLPPALLPTPCRRNSLSPARTLRGIHGAELRLIIGLPGTR